MSWGAGERFLGGGAVASPWPPTTAEELLPATEGLDGRAGAFRPKVKERAAGFDWHG